MFCTCNKLDARITVLEDKVCRLEHNVHGSASSPYIPSPGIRNQLNALYTYLKITLVRQSPKWEAVKVKRAKVKNA